MTKISIVTYGGLNTMPLHPDSGELLGIQYTLIYNKWLPRTEAQYESIVNDRKAPEDEMSPPARASLEHRNCILFSL
jgi:hypothetical protein